MAFPAEDNLRPPTATGWGRLTAAARLVIACSLVSLSTAGLVAARPSSPIHGLSASAARQLFARITALIGVIALTSVLPVSQRRCIPTPSVQENSPQPSAASVFGR